MLGCPEVRKTNNCTAYFDFFSFLSCNHPQWNKYLFFLLKMNWCVCFTATQCPKSDFFKLLKPLKGFYFGSVVFQCNKFSNFRSSLTKVFWTTRISLDVPFRKSMYTQTENMSAKSSCYLTNFKHSLHLQLKTSTNWGRNPRHRNFSVIFFLYKSLGFFFVCQVKLPTCH